MRLFLLILSLALLIGCIKANTLSEVLIGEWTLDHYEAYKDGNPTTAAGSLDKSIKFSSNGRCQWNGKASFDYTLSGNTITLHNEKRVIEYKVTYYTLTSLVMYFYMGDYKMVYYLEKF